MLSADGITPVGDMVYNQRWLGPQGWNTGGAIARDGSWHKVWFDVTTFFARPLNASDDMLFEPLLMFGKVPQECMNYGGGADGRPGETGGGWYGGFGGPDAQVSYIIVATGLYVSSNFLGARTYTATAFGNSQVTQGGKIVDPNSQANMRTWARKGATDPINRDVCYFNFAEHGFYRTLDRGVTVTKIAWLPDPTHNTADPGKRWGILAVNEAGPTTGGGSNRAAQVFACSAGPGGYLSNDGLDSGARITNMILYGTVAPAAGTGIDGDYYVNRTTSLLHGPKAGGAWPAGAAVQSGAAVHYGEGFPGNGIGANGDYFVDVASDHKHGPKAGGVWPDRQPVIAGLTNKGFFRACSSACWIAGKLFVNVVHPQFQNYDPITSAMTGGVGGSVGRADNIRIYDPAAAAGARWSSVAHGATGVGFNSWFQCLTPTAGGGYLAWADTGEVMKTADGTNFLYWMGNGWIDATVNLRLHAFALMLPTRRAAVAGKYRFEGIGFAISDPILHGDHLIAHLGFGPAETSLAAWPTQSATYGTYPLDKNKLPIWKEIGAGTEAKVGQVPLWLKGTLWAGSQDVAVARTENGSRGHIAAVYTFPQNGSLSDADDMARGPYSGFGVVLRWRSGQTATAGVGYTTDAKTWQLAPKQPVSGLNGYEPGGICCGKGYSALVLPGWTHNAAIGHVPSFTRDVRGTGDWQPLRIRKAGGAFLDLVGTDNNLKVNGFQGAYFSNVHKLCAVDPDHPNRHYLWNIGAALATDPGDPNGPTAWPYDPAEYGGIYLWDSDDGTDIANEVYNAKAATGFRSPQRFANFGGYDTSMLIGRGKMVLASNYLNVATAADNNRLVILDLTTWERRVIATGPGNFASIAFGDAIDGSDNLCLWGIAWTTGGQFGVFFSHDWWMPNPTWQGPYSAAMPTGGFPSRIDAKLAVGNEPKEWGRIGVSCKTRGTVEGRFQSGPSRRFF